MIAGSQLRDTQGEMLSVEGADISALEAGRGVLNDNHNSGFFNNIGRVTGAKKIFKKEDCDNERQEYYWEKVKAPFIYVKGFLYDDGDHPNAKAAAAILRNINKTDSPLHMKASVEGGVVSRGISDRSLLARTKIHSVALTFTPANQATLVEPLSLDKTADYETDIQLIKSVEHLAKTNVPSFRHIYRDASAEKVFNNFNKIRELFIEAGIDYELPAISKNMILRKSLKKKIAKNINKINELVMKAKEDSLVADKNKYRKERKKFSEADKLDSKITSKPGVSTTGIEVRRGDARQQGAISHGYTRVNSPKVHLDNAKKDIKSRLNKNAIKQVAQAVALGAAMSGAPNVEAQNPHVDAFKQLSAKNPTLAAIGMIESSGGKNLNHKTITDPKSMHYGHTAGGMFGIMPHSAALALKNNPDLAAKYPKLAAAAADISNNHKKFTERLNSDPQAAIDFANAILDRKRSKTKNDNMAIHSWLHGVKGSWNQYKKGGQKAIDSHPYVQKVNSHLKQENINKALTAGYGGAGAPTSQVGGAVLQCEALDGARGIKYITCEKCGKEQVHAKHQTKCRGCNTSFSLEKIFKMMTSKT